MRVISSLSMVISSLSMVISSAYSSPNTLSNTLHEPENCTVPTTYQILELQHHDFHHLESCVFEIKWRSVGAYIGCTYERIVACSEHRNKRLIQQEQDSIYSSKTCSLFCLRLGLTYVLGEYLSLGNLSAQILRTLLSNTNVSDRVIYPWCVTWSIRLNSNKTPYVIEGIYMLLAIVFVPPFRQLSGKLNQPSQVAPSSKCREQVRVGITRF